MGSQGSLSTHKWLPKCLPFRGQAVRKVGSEHRLYYVKKFWKHWMVRCLVVHVTLSHRRLRTIVVVHIFFIFLYHRILWIFILFIAVSMLYLYDIVVLYLNLIKLKIILLVYTSIFFFLNLINLFKMYLNLTIYMLQFKYKIKYEGLSNIFIILVFLFCKIFSYIIYEFITWQL